MNKTSSLSSEFVQQALHKLEESTGFQGRWEEVDGEFDGLITFDFNKHALQYPAVIKPKIDREIAITTLFGPGFERQSRLLVTRRLSDEMANRCRELGVSLSMGQATLS